MVIKSNNINSIPTATIMLFLVFIAGALTLQIVFSLPSIKQPIFNLYHVIEILTIPLLSVIFLWRFFDKPQSSTNSFELSKQGETQNNLAGKMSLLEAIMESVADGIIVINKDEQVVAVNSKFIEMWHIPEDLIKRGDSRIVFNSISGLLVDSEQFKCHFFNESENNDDITPDVVCLKNGLICEYDLKPLIIDGRKAGRVLTCRDVTEQEHVIHALVDSEAHYRQIFEQTDDALVIFDGDFQKTIEVNPAAEMIFRQSREELIKRPPIFFFSPGEYAKIRQQQADGCFDTFRIFDMRLLVDELREMLLSVNGKRIELNGQPVFLCTISDVTEKVLMDEHANIIQAKLIQANKMTSLGVLVTGIAHEINNPNNYILASSELLTRAWKDIHIILTEHYKKHQDLKLGGIPYITMQNEIQELLDNITGGSQCIRDIVNTLKDFSRSGSGAIRNDIDLNQIVKRVTTIINHQIKRHTNRFSLETAPGLPLVTGNHQQLEQVVINLILNAIQAISSPDQGITLTTRHDTQSNTVCFEVVDEGIGIAPEIADKVMEPFFTTRLDSGGTGLGLSISMAIIKAHKGMLTFSSIPGNGTKFLVQLPITKTVN